MLAAAASWLGLPAHAAASDPAESAAVSLDTVVVTATRVPESSVDLPVSVDRLDQQQIQQGQLQVNLSESLMSVPGVSAEERQNYAQDLQLSVRGFGARSSFGVRGVRLYADGIPGTMPDGQGQFSHFDLSSAEDIEVLRGPFSALYGNSSGGVIAIFTRDAPAQAELDATAEYGSFGMQRYALQGMGQPGGVNLVVDAAYFDTDGYRDHSAAERENVNAKAVWQLDAQSKLTLIANAIDMPNSDDPLGLTRAQLTADPTQPGTNALAYDTRKALEQSQLGAHYERTLSADDDLSAMLYGGQRATTQYQAIPAGSEAMPVDPGGVINLARTYWGIDTHITDRRTLAGTDLQLTGGVSFDDLDEARRGYLNFIGNELGVEGALRRAETNWVYDLDEYLQAQWDPSPDWRALAGIRNSTVDVSSYDHLATAGASVTGVRYGAANPVAGVTYRAAPGLHLYGAYGRGFETPTLNDLAYRSTDGSLQGLNFALLPARSDNYEIGAKAEAGPLQASVAGFFIRTVDELAVEANAFGRTVYENIPLTQRKGTELELVDHWGYGFSGHLAYTYLQALTGKPYKTCEVVPCTQIVIAAGHRLPAVPADAYYAGLTWQHEPSGVSVTLETVVRSQIYVNDLNSDAAAGYWLENLHCDLAQQGRVWRVTESLRIDNLADRRYVGSVIVNATNAAYFEPEPGRTAYLMVTASYL
jgi:iron complex outermembrane recepter protein